MIMKGDRLIIPSSVQMPILAKLHESHQGIEKNRLRAGATVYWKNRNKYIDEIVKKCDVCQQMQRSQPHEPLMPHEILVVILYAVVYDNWLAAPSSGL